METICLIEGNTGCREAGWALGLKMLEGVEWGAENWSGDTWTLSVGTGRSMEALLVSDGCRTHISERQLDGQVQN